MTETNPPAVPARSISSARTARSRETKSGRLTLAESIAQQIDWTPTCLPGTERATIVRQVLDLDEIASDDDYWLRIDALAASAAPDAGQARADHLAAGIRRFADDCKLLLEFGGLDNRVARSIAQQERNLRALLAEPSGGTVQAPESPTDSTPKAGRWGSGEAETTTDTVQAPDVAGPLVAVRVGPPGSGYLVGPFTPAEAVAWRKANVTVPGMQWAIVPLLPDAARPTAEALLGTDATPDRLAWISKAGETAAAERHARYQETACARRPAATSEDPAQPDLAYARSEVDKWLADNDPYCILPTRTERIPALLARLDELEGTS